MSPKKATRKSAKSTTATGKTFKGFSDEERAAMKERAQELMVGKADWESAVLAKIAAMQGPDRAMGERLHAIIKGSAPALSPKTWYGMPAYANRDGKVVCFFQSAQKFKTRYATLGFSDAANLDEGAMWPTTFALTKVTAAEEARIAALVKESGELRAEFTTGPALGRIVGRDEAFPRDENAHHRCAQAGRTICERWLRG